MQHIPEGGFRTPRGLLLPAKADQKRDFKDEVWDLSEGKFVDRLLENFLPQAGLLLRKFFSTAPNTYP